MTGQLQSIATVCFSAGQSGAKTNAVWHAGVPGGHTKYHLLTTALLILALALYAGGATAGSTFVLLLGAAAEVLFWVRVLRRPRHSLSKIAAAER